MSLDLDHALRVAITAAEEAGELLRQARRELPADVAPDAAVETRIAAQLTAAFPHFGLRAEEHPELNRPGAGPDDPVWLIDPHDGTSAFRRGYRGPTVSIGLIRNGRPILGVVYAYAAPDDDGDLFTWHEDGAVLMRNHRPIPVGEAPAAFGPYEIVAISNDGDALAERYARALSPARYRPVPGIAYRLALLAAGEVDAAISLFGPRDFDLAGGHALLRGAGLVLLDERGRPVTYTADRPRRYGACFAAAPHLAAELAAREWLVLLRPPGAGAALTDEAELDDLDADHLAAVPPPPPAPLHVRRALCLPAVGGALPTAALLSRAQGAWLGQLVGDALGSQVEFQEPHEIAGRWPGGVVDLLDGGTYTTLAGQPTDDSELALALARTLLRDESSGPPDWDAIARAYRRWYESDPFDIGNTTRTALSAATGPSPAATARHAASQGSQANGALMRVSPLALAAIGRGWDDATLARHARSDATLTHPNPVCQSANALYTVLMARALRGDLDAGSLLEQAQALAYEQAADPLIHEIVADARRGPPSDVVHQMGWLRHALHLALYHAARDTPFADALPDIVGRGGDTDTNGCIAGALLGALQGREAIPRPWRDRVITCRPIAGLPGVRRPRPAAYWPVDALTLAERLIQR